MKKNCILLSATLALIFIGAGCSSPRYAKSGATSSKCNSACGGYTRVVGR